MDSRTELSLLESLKGGGFAASVITTFNAYLPFYEYVVLPKLRAAGSRHNIVLMDAGQCARAMAQPDTAARLAGRAYMLVPIESAGAFHPKLLLLLGKAKAALHVGSHNLTLSGYGRNAELTSLVASSKEEAGSAEIGATWAAVLGWVQREGERLPEEVRAAVKGVERLVPWLAQAPLARGPSTNSRLLVQSHDGTSLWDQLVPLLPRKVVAIAVVGAFFDARLAFLAELQRVFPNAAMKVMIQPHTVSLPCSAKIATPYDWRDGSALAEAGCYLHAKAVWIQASGGDDVLLVGSANPSAPAWLAAAASRNDEAMLLLRGRDAQQAAQDLGIAHVGELPRINKESLRDITGRDALPAPEDARNYRRPCVGVLEGRELSLNAAGLSRVPSKALFVDFAGCGIAEATDIRLDSGWLRIKVPDGLPLGQMASVRLQLPGETDVVVIVHRTADIADLCRSGAQQVLRLALEGLNDDAHDIAALVSIVERAIFTDVTAELPEQIGARRGTDKERPQSQRPDTLVVPAKEMKQRLGRRRLLRPGGDLAYLLEVLFSEIRIDSAKRDLDQHGRSEEEQVGKDDDVPLAVRTDDAALAKLCRSKVSRLVKRAAPVARRHREANRRACSAARAPRHRAIAKVARRPLATSRTRVTGLASGRFDACPVRARSGTALAHTDCACERSLRGTRQAQGAAVVACLGLPGRTPGPLLADGRAGGAI